MNAPLFLGLKWKSIWAGLTPYFLLEYTSFKDGESIWVGISHKLMWVNQSLNQLT